MAGDSVVPSEEEVKQGLLSNIDAWGKASLPPALLATLTTALHARPLQLFPLLLFTPPLFFSSYLNLSGFTTGSAGLTFAFSSLYALLALRRRNPAGLRGKFSARGLIRGGAIGLAGMNAVGSGYVYARGDFRKDDEARRERRRWER